jgi:ATP-dependent helicase/nuclease subunit A
MTRAKERLILILNPKNKVNALERAAVAASHSEKIPPFIVRNAQSFEEWILACVMKRPSSQYIHEQIDANGINLTNSNSHDCWKINFNDLKIDDIEKQKTLAFEKSQKIPIQNQKIIPENELSNEIKKRLSFVYFNEEMTKIPKKISVSELVKKSNQSETAIKKFNLIDESSKFTLESGNAYHKFLCFVDFKKAISDFDAQVKHLINSGFLTNTQSRFLNKNTIQKFLNGNLCQRILKSSKILREYDFTVRMPANCYDLSTSTYYSEKLFSKNLTCENDEKILISGVIDCVFEENGKFIIIDYKTDKISNLEVLYQNYAKQLIFYKYALEKCEDVNVKELIIYSLYLNDFYTF